MHQELLIHFRHLTPSDVKVSKNFMNVTIKWSKTLQTRDKVHIITVPKLSCPLLCPVRALQQAIALYNPAPHHPLFQVKTSKGWSVLIDSRIRKVLAKLNVKMGLPPSHFTFHTFWRSGASFAYNSHMPLGVLSTMAPGRRIVSGLTFKPTKILIEILLHHLLGLSIMPSYSCVWVFEGL